MAAIAGKIGALYMKTTDAATSFTTEATTGNLAKTRYTITSTTKRYWDKNSTLTVYLNGSPVTTGFTIEYVGGVIVFNVALTTEVVTVSGKYWTVSQVAGFYNWSLDGSMDMLETTTFEDGGKKTYIPGLLGWTASSEKYYVTNNISDRLGEEVIVVLYVDATSNKRRYEGYALISGDSISTAVAEVISENISFQGNQMLYYREG